MKKILVIILALFFIPWAQAISIREGANSIGMAVHPIYICLGYTVAPILNGLFSFFFNLGMSLTLTVICCPFGILFLLLSGFFKILTLPIIYGFPLIYSVLGIAGRNPNFFIGSIGDLIGHFFVDIGSLMALTVVCLPIAAVFISLGDMITLCGNGLSMVVVGNKFAAVQQFIGSVLLSFILFLAVMNIVLWGTLIWIPFSFLVSSLLILLTNVVGVGTDLIGQVITYSARCFRILQI